MLVMFAAGMSSFGGMLVLGVAMGAEKNFPWGRRLSSMFGVLLVAGAAVDRRKNAAWGLKAAWR
jgi:predicted metal-binding membrane protein